MTNVAFDHIEDYRDVETMNAYAEAKEAGKDMDAFLKAVHQQGRDNVRTPIQWDDSEHAGFTNGTPWIKVNPNYKTINAKAVLADPNSTFYYFQKMLKVRKEHSTLVYGDYELIDNNSEVIYAYRRWDENGTYYIYLNFTSDLQTKLPMPNMNQLELVISNYEASSDYDVSLRAWEARIYKVV